MYYSHIIVDALYYSHIAVDALYYSHIVVDTLYYSHIVVDTLYYVTYEYMLTGSQCLTYIFRASCCSARLSRAQVPGIAGSSVRDS